MSDQQVKKTVGKLLIAVAAMFAFGYALVPLVPGLLRPDRPRQRRGGQRDGRRRCG